MDEDQHIRNSIHKNSIRSKTEYRIQLTASVECIRFLLKQGVAFRGHDESDGSSNQGNFLELLQFLVDHDENVRDVALKNAPDNLKMTSPLIQNDIVNDVAVQTTNTIITDMNNAFFSILVNEAKDISVKEQIAIIFRYVDKKGCVIERFIGIIHVANMTAETLKEAIDALLCKHGFSISCLRDQGFDGASNMRRELNVANVVSIVGASSKRRDILREKHSLKVIQALKDGDVVSGRCLNQATEIKRSADTRWSSHYCTLINFTDMFSSVIDVLDEIAYGKVCEQKADAFNSLGILQSFDFIFSLHLTKNVLGISHDLSQALQKDDQDIVNAMDLVKICKRQLQNMRNKGCYSLLNEVVTFCDKEKVMVPDMSDQHLFRGRSKRKSPDVRNLHYYRFDSFCAMIDLQLQELNNRFNEANIELLLCVACLSSNNSSFASFNKERVIVLAQKYPTDFSTMELSMLGSQLDVYIDDMQSSPKFHELKGISELAQKLVETGKHKTYNHVYLLTTLALVLLVSTTTVERALSAMNIIKNRMRNRMGDQWLNDSSIVYLENDVFNTVDNESIIQRFQNIAPRRKQL